MARSSWIGRKVALVALVLGLSSTLVRAEDGPRPPSAALAAAFAEPCTQVELRRRLAGLPASELAELFQVAAHGLLPAASGEPRPLGAEWQRVVRESLAARPRRELVPLLEDLAARPPSAPESREAQLLLESVGSADHLRLLVRLTCPPPARPGLVPELRAGFESAVSAILVRDPAALARLPALLAESPAALAAPLVDGLARQPSAEATRLLAGLLGRAPGLDVLLLLRLAERGPLVGEAAGLHGSVRRYLRERDPVVVGVAAQACGRLGDEEAIGELVTLLGHEDGRVRASAIDALQRLTGLAYGPDPERWLRWYRAEERWWEQEAEPLLIHVERGRGLEFVRASREVLEHRLYRARIARAFALGLSRAQDEDAELACQALARLRSPVGVAALVEALDHRDGRVRLAAWKALRTITGVELPPDPAAWARFEG
ncbi:MAG TPA: HEAT repeat domain-containing protein [Planctomycetota bacterium]